MPLDTTGSSQSRNVLGGRLETCSIDPVTGWTRTGCCETGPQDLGSHTVCAVMTAEFLAFSRNAGNDLSTPMPQYGFPGLTPGDRWCLCAPRWAEAFQAACAPQVLLRATHEGALEWCRLEDLQPTQPAEPLLRPGANPPPASPPLRSAPPPAPASTPPCHGTPRPRSAPPAHRSSAR